MLSTLRLCLLWATFLCTSNGLFGQIYINEFMASNDATIADEAGEFEDWVELYNAGNSPVNVGGMYFTDDLTEPTLWQIPTTNAVETTIPAGGFLLFWFDKDLTQGIRHVNAKLGGSGEAIGLFDTDGATTIDQYTFGQQLADISEGRVPDGGSEFDFYVEPTPGATNDTDPGAGMVATPTVSMAGGLYSDNVSVSITTTTPDADIRYTLDGSEPTENSPLYNNTLSFNDITALRVRAFFSPLAASDIVTNTYLIGVSHTTPIVSLVGDPDEIFDPATGMYPNYEQDIEINVNTEFYEPDGSEGFNQVVEMEINGTASASLPQKSLALKAKGSLGASTFDHNIFPDDDSDEYRSLILRNGGNGWAVTFLRDATVTSLVRDLSDVDGLIDEPKVDGQAYRLGTVYINGEYWGMHHIRERTDKRYIKANFGLDDNEIDFIENKDEVKEGDDIAWDAMQDFLEANDFSIDANFEQLSTMVDVEDYMDYVIFNIYVDNHDWPGNNNKFWRERTPDGKFRWLLFDLDFSFGLFTSNGWNTNTSSDNSLARLVDADGYDWPAPEWSARLFQNLLENEGWRTAFINRMADQINVLYTPERVNARLDEFSALQAPEKNKHNERWGNLWNQETNLQNMRDFGQTRANNVYNHFIQGFSEVSGTSNVTVNISPSNGGQVNLNTLHIGEADAPFTGKYFRGVDIPVQAAPNQGFVFQSWSGAVSGNEMDKTLNLSSNVSFTANFTQGSTSTAGIVINEINYNSVDPPNSGDWIELHNPTNSTVNISGWYLEDEDGDWFGFPANTTIAAGGYLVLAEDLVEFSAFYPNVTNVIGEFGDNSPFQKMKFSNGGELLTLNNAGGTTIDEVEYDDNAPWPSEADGDGPTLQLTNAALDNALASSWVAIEATPGAQNGGSTNQQSQTITFAAISDKLTTDTPFNISATASSGLGVSFIVISGPATISGNTITLTGAVGTVIVEASQNGNATYLPAANVSRSFNVTNGNTQQSQTITFAAISDKLDTAAPFNASATASSGLAVTLSIVSGPATISGNTITLTGQLGDVTVRATQAGNANYFAATPVDRTFNVYEDTPPTDEYCASAGQQPWQEWIENVTFGTINNTSFKDGYADNTNLSTDVEKGSSYTIELTTGFSWFSQDEFYTVWIDYNQNGTFENSEKALEQALTTPPDGTLSATLTGTIAIPSSAATGTTRMRVSMKRDAFATACENFQFGEVEDYSVNIEAATTVTTLSIDCPQNIVAITTDGQNSVSVVWDTPTGTTDCADGNTIITQLAGPTSGSAFDVNSTTTITYQATNSCNQSETCSFTVSITEGSTPTGYCVSSSQNPWQDWLTQVTLGSIDNASGKSIYSDFTNQSTTLERGGTYPISLAAGFSWTTYNEYFRIWIDYNKNGVFEANEMAMEGILNAPVNGTSAAFISGNITVPNNAQMGATRMRVSMSRDSYASPCGTLSFGEVEDYTINIAQQNLGLVVAETLYFDAAIEGRQIRLHWATNTEYKNDYFVLEQAFDGQDFETIKEQESLYEGGFREYNHWNTQPKQGLHHFRLKQVFEDGTYIYSNIRTVDFDFNVAQFSAFPNPTTDFIYVNLSDIAGGAAEIKLISPTGAILFEQKYQHVPITPTAIDVRDLRGGLYLISVKPEGLRQMSTPIMVAK